jgi:hypothetical protein
VGCWNAFLQAGTTEIERIAWRGIGRSYQKRHPTRDDRERVLRDMYAAERSPDRTPSRRLVCKRWGAEPDPRVVEFERGYGRSGA